MRRYMSGGHAGGMLGGGQSIAATAAKRFIPVLESLMKLIDAGLLSVAYTEWVFTETISAEHTF